MGYSFNGTVYRPVLWLAGSTTPTDLWSLSGSDGSYAGFAYGINNDGYIVGKSISSGVFHAFGTATARHTINQISDDLGTIVGNDTLQSVAYAINSARQIAGASQMSTHNDWHAFLKAAGTGKNQGYTDLGTLGTGSYPSSYGYAVNKSGVVVGTSGGYAFIWQPGVGIRKLDDLASGGSSLFVPPVL